jgi:hypothetical protein
LHQQVSLGAQLFIASADDTGTNAATNPTAATKNRWFKLGIKEVTNVRRNPGKNKIEKD